MPRYATIDDVIASYPARFNAEKAQSLDDTVYMQLTGENARDVLLYVHHGELDITEGTVPEDPTLRLTADADDWLAVENGQLNPMMGMMTGKIKMKGSVPFATKFMGLFGYSG
jgi:putative sterol carrier protein